MEHLLFWMIPVSSLLALLLAWYFYRQMMKESEGTPVMQKIASHVRQGAMSYLKQQYKIVGLVFLALVVLFSVMAYGFNLQNSWVPIAFLTGGFFSGLSGFLGMKTATYASARTANAARNSHKNGGELSSEMTCNVKHCSYGVLCDYAGAALYLMVGHIDNSALVGAVLNVIVTVKLFASVGNENIAR